MRSYKYALLLLYDKARGWKVQSFLSHSTFPRESFLTRHIEFIYDLCLVLTVVFFFVCFPDIEQRSMLVLASNEVSTFIGIGKKISTCCLCLPSFPDAVGAWSSFSWSCFHCWGLLAPARLWTGQLWNQTEDWGQFWQLTSWITCFVLSSLCCVSLQQVLCDNGTGVWGVLHRRDNGLSAVQL